MKVYDFQVDGEHEWICASSIFQAKRVYKNYSSMPIKEIDEEVEIDEIEEKDWYTYAFGLGDKQTTLLEYMGKPRNPCLIASTIT